MLGKLESLRGIAACLVILFHSPFNYGEDAFLFFQNSYLFVDFFFILSGFVMSHAYSEKITGHLSFGEYVALRLGRIYPLHLFMLLLYVPYIGFKQYMYNIGLDNIDPLIRNNSHTFVSNIFLLHAMGLHETLSWNVPSWSISTEFYTYILFYILSITLDKGRKPIIPLLIAIACYVFLFRLGRPNLNIHFDFGFIRCVGAFYIGVSVFRVHRIIDDTLLSASFVNVMEILIFIALITGVIFSNNYMGCLIFTIITFACCIFIFSNSSSGILGGLLESHLFRTVGVWSYSIYLTHWLILKIITDMVRYIFEVDPKSPMGFLALLVNGLAVVITVLASRFSYVYIEKKYRDHVKLKIATYKIKKDGQSI